MEFDEDECPELVPIDIFNNAKDEISDQRVPVTIVTGFLGILISFWELYNTYTDLQYYKV